MPRWVVSVCRVVAAALVAAVGAMALLILVGLAYVLAVALRIIEVE
jgi:hypothetical protein